MTKDSLTTTRTERDDLVDQLNDKHDLFLITARGLSDEQARLTPTASALSIGGVIKHVADTSTGWLDFIERGAPDDSAEAGSSDWGTATEESIAAFMAGFQLLPDETLAAVIADYEQVHQRMLELARTVDLDQAHALPPAPWFPANAQWSNRRVLTHLLAEVAQHAGHADIIRETIDGQKTMG